MTAPERANALLPNCLPFPHKNKIHLYDPYPKSIYYEKCVFSGNATQPTTLVDQFIEKALEKLSPLLPPGFFTKCFIVVPNS